MTQEDVKWPKKIKKKIVQDKIRKTQCHMPSTDTNGGKVSILKRSN